MNEQEGKIRFEALLASIHRLLLGLGRLQFAPRVKFKATLPAMAEAIRQSYMA